MFNQCNDKSDLLTSNRISLTGSEYYVHPFDNNIDWRTGVIALRWSAPEINWPESCEGCKWGFQFIIYRNGSYNRGCNWWICFVTTLIFRPVMGCNRDCNWWIFFFFGYDLPYFSAVLYNVRDWIFSEIGKHVCGDDRNICIQSSNLEKVEVFI